MKRFEPWNAMRFTLAGAVCGAGYGLGMAAVIGILSRATADLLIWDLISTMAFGAVLTGGVAVVRNYLAFCFTHEPEPPAVQPVVPRQYPPAPARRLPVLLSSPDKKARPA